METNFFKEASKRGGTFHDPVHDNVNKEQVIYHSPDIFARAIPNPHSGPYGEKDGRCKSLKSSSLILGDLNTDFPNLRKVPKTNNPFLQQGVLTPTPSSITVPPSSPIIPPDDDVQPTPLTMTVLLHEQPGVSPTPPTDDYVPSVQPTPSSVTVPLHEQLGLSPTPPTDDYVPLVQPTPSSMTIFLHEQSTSDTRALQGQKRIGFVNLGKKFYSELRISYRNPSRDTNDRTATNAYPRTGRVRWRTN